MLINKVYVEVFQDGRLVADCSVEFFFDWLRIKFSNSDFCSISSSLSYNSYSTCNGYDFFLIEEK